MRGLQIKSYSQDSKLARSRLGQDGLEGAVVEERINHCGNKATPVEVRDHRRAIMFFVFVGRFDYPENI